MRKYLVITIILIALSGCSSNKLKEQLPAAKKMEIAQQYLAKKKYNKAIPYLQQIAFERNSALTAEAQMLLAESYFAQNKFTEARFEYQELIRLFGDYKKIDEAYFKIGVCYYEESLDAQYTQEETEQAIDAFQTFISKFPFSKLKDDAITYINKCNTKLIEKKYYNGYTYYKMYDYSAALMYFDEIIALGNNNEPDRKSLYYSAKIYAERKDNKNLEAMYKKLQSRYPESKETKDIAAYLK